MDTKIIRSTGKTELGTGPMYLNLMSTNPSLKTKVIFKDSTDKIIDVKYAPGSCSIEESGIVYAETTIGTCTALIYMDVVNLNDYSYFPETALIQVGTEKGSLVKSEDVLNIVNGGVPTEYIDDLNNVSINEVVFAGRGETLNIPPPIEGFSEIGWVVRTLSGESLDRRKMQIAFCTHRPAISCRVFRTPEGWGEWTRLDGSPLSIAGVARPINPKKGSSFFDTSLGKPIWWSGTSWVNSIGEVV